MIWVTGKRISLHIDNMSLNLGNGSNGLHQMVYEKLHAIESELSEIKATVESVGMTLSKIEDSVVTDSEENPFSFENKPSE